MLNVLNQVQSIKIFKKTCFGIKISLRNHDALKTTKNVEIFVSLVILRCVYSIKIIPRLMVYLPLFVTVVFTCVPFEQTVVFFDDTWDGLLCGFGGIDKCEVKLRTKNGQQIEK